MQIGFLYRDPRDNRKLHYGSKTDQSAVIRLSSVRGERLPDCDVIIIKPLHLIDTDNTVSLCMRPTRHGSNKVRFRQKLQKLQSLHATDMCSQSKKKFGEFTFHFQQNHLFLQIYFHQQIHLMVSSNEITEYSRNDYFYQ